MLIEHIGLLSWVHERPCAQKQKDHAQDGQTLIEMPISIRRSCHGLDVSDGVHPLVSLGHLALSSGRIAAGPSLRMIRHSDRDHGLVHDRFRESKAGLLR
jgi:hypothetical protein